MQHAPRAGWHAGAGDILMIPDDNRVNCNLIMNYGQLTLQNVQAHVNTYIQQQTRCAQNSRQMFKCISNSVMEDAHLKIIVETETYMRQGTEAGPILFKLLTQKSNS